MRVRKVKHWLFTVILIALSWLGLSGVADNIVEWRDWYEVGVIEHWRTVKTWIDENFLFWAPFRIPSWLFDFAIIGSVMLRSLTSEIRIDRTDVDTEAPSPSIW